MAITHGFELLRDEDIPELNSKARLFRHLKTGAQLLALENGDENKVFGITFRTPPADSTGVAHILEHSVLCGSRKYPVKEPFVQLLKGSLKTFANAFTYPDKTCYPTASQNRQDFYNLTDVYLDAVFYPRLTPLVFQQEGWHYELHNLNEPLIIRGVVFNEMKGSYSSPERLIAEYSQQSLFPGHIYGLHSGGHPRHVPELTYEELLSFHRTYYHPSNARIFFYGDDHSGERLRLVDEYLKDFDAMQVDSLIPDVRRMDHPQYITHSYAVSRDSATSSKGMLTVNWLLTENTDSEAVLGLQILSHVLVGTPASPLRKKLLDSGLGEDLLGVGLDTELRELFFSTGLKGIDVRRADDIEHIILETLANLAREGIHPHTVEASLNTVEFALRENNTGSFPRGLALMLRALSTWLYDGDPFAPLAFEAPLAGIKACLAAGETYFEDLIRRHFLDNPHRTTLLLEPDPELRQQEEASEKEHLARVRAAMSQQDLERIIADTRLLQVAQETPNRPEALATIPTLKRSDLDPRNRVIPSLLLQHQQVPVLFHDLPTNHIAYLDLAFDLHALPGKYLPYVPLFGRVLPEMGTRREDSVTLLQRIGRQTGGIRPTSFTSMVRGTQNSTGWLLLRSKAMVGQLDHLLDILRDILLEPSLDNQDRFRQIVLEEKAGQEAGLVPAGHHVVDARLRARFNEADWAAEQMDGISYLFFLRQLAQAVTSDWPGVLNTLEDILHILLNRNAMRLNVTLDEGNWSRFEPQLSAFLGDLPIRPAEWSTWSPQLEHGSEGMILPARVNYVGKGASLYQFGYTFDGSALAILKYLRNTWLWERVRVQGGAYGVHCLFDRRSGVLTYLSYRDPNLLATLDNYDQAANFLRQLTLSDEELTRAIIGAIGDVDAYMLPDAKGYAAMRRYLSGDTEDMRQRMRDEILTTTAADFKAFADLLQQVAQHGQVVVLGSEYALDTANAAHPGWLDLLRVL